MKNIVKTISASLLTVLLLTGCGLKNDEAVIKINNDKITKQEFDEKFKEASYNPMIMQFGIDIKKEPDSFPALIIKDSVINELIFKHIIDMEAEKRNIKISEKDVETELKNVMDKTGSKERFNQMLKQNGVTAAQFKKDLAEELKIQKLIDSVSIINITDEAAHKYYNENLDKFKYPDKVRASHILISANPEQIKEMILSKEENKNLSQETIDNMIKQEMENRYNKAKEIQSQVSSWPQTFAGEARANSQDPGSAQEGGDLGYFTKEQMVEPFASTAFSMKPGTISDVIQTVYGYHVIYAKDRMAAGTEPFDKIKEELKGYLANQEKIKVLNNLVNNVKNEANIEYVDSSFNPDELQKKIKEKTKEIQQSKNKQN